MHDLPIGCMNDKMGKSIGRMLRVVKECDANEDGYGCGITQRVLIKMKLDKHISRGRFINVEGCKEYIPLTYEKLPKICFECGRIVHGEEHCNGGKLLPKTSNGQFGPWLREASD